MGVRAVRHEEHGRSYELPGDVEDDGDEERSDHGQQGLTSVRKQAHFLHLYSHSGLCLVEENGTKAARGKEREKKLAKVARNERSRRLERRASSHADQSNHLSLARSYARSTLLAVGNV